MKILFTGGGTLGSVTPLLALHEVLAHNPSQPPLTIRGGEVGLRAYWIGTRNGIERELVERASIPLYTITAGKLRRYFDWRNFFTPIETLIGFFEALSLLRRLRPTHVFSAGGYVAVPVITAAAFLGIPSYGMQLDVRQGLANRLIAPLVKKMFVVFPETSRFFPAHKVIVTGSVVRKNIRTVIDNRQQTKERPTVLILGGGTGALSLNELVVSALPELTKICRVVHVAGKNKFPISNFQFPDKSQLFNYQTFAFLTDEISYYYREADLVITRAGMGTLSELAALAKAAIVIPLPGTHQEENAALLASHHAAVVVQQKECTPEKLIALVSDLLHDTERRLALGHALHETIPTNGAEKIMQSMQI